MAVIYHGLQNLPLQMQSFAFELWENPPRGNSSLVEDSKTQEKVISVYTDAIQP